MLLYYSHPIPGDWTINLLIKAVYESESGRDRPFQAAPPPLATWDSAEQLLLAVLLPSRCES
jgi:hypothetical protein